MLRYLTGIAVEISGINHEFSTIPGVRKDVFEILVSLKEVVFKKKEKKVDLEFGHLKIEGFAVVMADLIKLPFNLEIGNLSHYIEIVFNLTLLKLNLNLNMEMDIS